MDSFDFDQWQALARDDVEAFVRRRREILAAAIAAVAPERRASLLALQDEIEALRAMTPGPDQMMSTLIGMMMDRFDALAALKTRFEQAARELDSTVDGAANGEGHTRLKP